MEISATQTNKGKEADIPLRGKRNWPLIVGFGLVMLIAIFAIIGPNIAPKDPAEESNISMIEGQWYVPPFDIGTPGYPLGSDRFGRDNYSRLLWGIRPTMIMVLVVAVVRLFLGVIIGLSAGWFTGKSGRVLNSLIQVALALPVLLVALGAIAIVGVELGIWAFIIGLSLTGWVDTALQVREQTRIVKNQVYVEAAGAIGASNQQILSNHILKQITPMLLMLFAFEVSSTLMLTAGLGFLGYYIGGDVWVETDDFVARRISGAPELGQMLATSWLTLTKPWALVAVGTTVFITVLGFNLIGEGLRQNIGFHKVHRKNSISEIRIKSGLWFDNYIWHPLIQFFRIKPLRLGFTIIGVFFLLSLGSLFMIDAATQANSSKVSALFNHRESPQAGELLTGPDGQSSALTSGTEEEILINTVDPGISSEADIGIVWSYEASDQIMFVSQNEPDGLIHLTTRDDKLHIIKPDGEIYNVIQLPASPFYQMGDTGRSPALSIEPIIFPDGTIIEISGANTVYAMSIDGEILWELILESAPAEYPIQDELGNMYFIDNDAAMNAYNKDGLKWRFQTEAADIPAGGIAVDQEGNIYYVVTDYSKGYIQAVSSEGENRWVVEAKTRDFYDELHISQDGQYISLAEDLISTNSGELIEYENADETDEFIFALNGQNFMRSLHTVSEWQPGPEGIQILGSGSGIVSEEDTTLKPPLRSAADSNGVIWLSYPEKYIGGGIIVVWMSPEGEILGNHLYDRNFQTNIGVDMDRSLLTKCIWFDETNSIECSSYSPYSDEAVWSATIQDIPSYDGAYIDGDIMYVFGENDEIFSINLGGPAAP